MSDPSSTRKRKTRNSTGDDGAQNIVIRLPKAQEDGDDSAKSNLPVLCSFPGGLPRGVQKVTTDDDEIDEAALNFRWSENIKTKRRTLVGKDHACVFTAASRSSEGKTESQTERYKTRMCVGMYDKHKKRLTLFDVHDDGYVHSFAQHVPNYKGSGDTRDLSTARQQYQALYEDFGSAKKRRAIKSKEANRVDVDSVVGAGQLVVDSVLKGESMSESNKRAILEEKEQRDNGGDSAAPSSSLPQHSAAVDAATEAWRNEFLPPHNRNATEPSKIYNFVEIVGGQGLWQDFSHHVEKAMKQDDVAYALIEGLDDKGKAQGKTKIEIPGARPKHKWRPSLISLVKRILQKHKAKSPSNNESLKKQLICSHVLHLMLHLYLTLRPRVNIPKVLNHQARYFGAPGDFGRFWVQSFTTESIHPRNSVAAHMMSKPNKDKCCISMFLLLMMAEGGDSMTCSNIKPFLNELQMEARDASNLLRLAGCSVTRNPKTGDTGALLLAPLTFPALKSSGRGRRSRG